MQDLSNKIVFISGASSGIGAACARRFAKQGCKLILCARRLERLNSLLKELKTTYGTQGFCFELDVRNLEQVQQKLRNLPKVWSNIDILVNNAGLSRGLTKLQEGDINDWEEMIDTNIKGLLYVTKEILPGMIERGQGDVVNIGSIAGHEVYPKGNVYCATKFAVDALTKGIRLDLIGTPIRVSTVDPGLVETEFSIVRFHGDQNKAESVYEGLKPLTAKDIAEAVLFCVSCPPHMQIAEMIIFPTAQRSVSQVSRNKEE